MTELWDIYDENGNKTGRVAERDKMLRGEVNGFFLVVNIYVVNSKNEWLIQKRSLTKATHPGKWSITGGGVLSGEDSLTAALREAQEEIGISLDPGQMYLEKRLKRARSFNDVWVARADFDTADCNPEPAEVDEIRWVSADDLIRLVFGDSSYDSTYQTVVESLLKTRILWVVPYDPGWRTEFERIKAALLPQLDDLILDIVHVGSTSVEGLASKPILDFNIVIESTDIFPSLVERLYQIGYEHYGDGDIPGRERFRLIGETDLKTQHMYVCAKDNREHLRNIAFRDYLRRHDDARDAYAALKRGLASRFRHDIDGYIDGKSAFVEDILVKAKTEGFNNGIIPDA
jgi:GrpB-like predicted nucleotidyltransferase (UPF0157 family)/8-oxo-dGTP pyrophosphatase MutT (NUDIX family)